MLLCGSHCFSFSDWLTLIFSPYNPNQCHSSCLNLINQTNGGNQLEAERGGSHTLYTFHYDDLMKIMSHPLGTMNVCAESENTDIQPKSKKPVAVSCLSPRPMHNSGLWIYI